ncbi:glycosyl transferase family 2, partial [Campylobacter jejuni]|nr:glycosyl transferase family 2 [Campylobacter jejuni]
KLKSLEQYDDYMESLKIREHLSYKLGNAFIKHPFSFIFRINAIYKQWRNKEIE